MVALNPRNVSLAPPRTETVTADRACNAGEASKESFSSPGGTASAGNATVSVSSLSGPVSAMPTG